MGQEEKNDEVEEEGKERSRTHTNRALFNYFSLIVYARGMSTCAYEPMECAIYTENIECCALYRFDTATKIRSRSRDIFMSIYIYTM